MAAFISGRTEALVRRLLWCGPMWRRLVATSVLLALAACRHSEPVIDDPQVPTLIAALTRQNPNPVNVSPSGAFVLVKSMHATDFELEVRARGDGVVIARDRARDTQLAPTWRFDDGAIAFLSDQAGDQQHRVFVLDLASGQRKRIDAGPPTEATALRWEPRGTRVAYLVAERGRKERKLVVVDTAARSSPVVALDGLFEHTGFVWSPDGVSLAGVSHANPGMLAIGNSRTGAARTLLVANGAEIRSLAWSPDGTRLLVTWRRRSEPYFALAEISAATGDVVREIRRAGDISGPLYLPTDGIAFHVNTDGEIRVHTCRGRCTEPRRIGPVDGTSVITGFSADGAAAWILHTGRVSPPALLRVELASAATTTVHAARTEAAAGAVAGERIDVEAADGRRIPAYLWRARHVDGHAPAALVRVRGGPAGQAMRNWDPAIQLLVQRGVHVISVNYRGSSGYGASFENAPVHDHAERVSDVLAARTFAERALGVAPDRIVLLGHSYGALLVAEAARRDPNPVGTIVLLSYVGPPSSPAQLPTRSHVVVIHGENDVAMSPDEARRALAARFGTAALQAPRGQFIELPREGHTFRRVESWALVYATVLTLLERNSRPPVRYSLRAFGRAAKSRARRTIRADRSVGIGRDGRRLSRARQVA